MLHPNIKKNFELKISEIKNIGGSAQFFKSDKTEDFHVSNTLLIINQKEYDKQSILNTETFGPYTTIVLYDQIEQLSKHVTNLKGQLTCSIFSTELKSNKLHKEIFHLATKKAGRIVLNDVPTGVTVSRAMQHGGPYPASSDSRFTAVGSDGIYRFVRDVTIQQNII